MSNCIADSSGNTGYRVVFCSSPTLDAEATTEASQCLGLKSNVAHLYYR